MQHKATSENFCDFNDTHTTIKKTNAPRHIFAVAHSSGIRMQNRTKAFVFIIVKIGDRHDARPLRETHSCGMNFHGQVKCKAFLPPTSYGAKNTRNGSRNFFRLVSSVAEMKRTKEKKDNV